MQKRIASQGKVGELVKQVLMARLKVESQEELCRLVLRQLKKEDKNYSLSPIRAKRVALKIPEVEVKAKTKKTVRLQRIERCPVCESNIEPITIKNLLNRDTVVGFRCTDCAYESDLEAFMPMKYIFIWKSK